jgi:DNA-directed RNA polymerase beta subunit
MDYYGDWKKEELRQAWNKISTKNKELLLRAMCTRNNRELLKVVYGNEKYDSIVTNILLKINDEWTLRSVHDKFTLTTTEQLNQLLKNKIFSNDEKIKMMIDNQHLVSVDSFKTIIDSKNFYLISRFKSIPIKIQRILIRKNP